MITLNQWHRVWERKGCEVSGNDLRSLLEADGFDTDTGFFEASDWLKCSHMIEKHLCLETGDRVLEVGCGGGQCYIHLPIKA